MIGVRRTSVTDVASELQKAGMISYSRGRIHIENIGQIRASACECDSRVISFDVRWPVMDIISFSGAPSSAIVRPPLFGVRAPCNEVAQRRRISCETSCRTRLG